jgi:hypothetical protein
VDKPRTGPMLPKTHFAKTHESNTTVKNLKRVRK